MNKILAIIALLMLLSAPAYAGKTVTGQQVNLPPVKLNTASIIVPAFSSIHIAGNLNVYIKKGVGDYVTVTGDPQAISALTAFVKHHTLYLKPKRKYSGKHKRRIVVHIDMKSLNTLIVNGNTFVRVKNVPTRGLTVINNNGNINLSGTIHVHSIINNGIGSINMRWVKSNNLTILNKGAGIIKLAGVANHLSARVFDKATLDAKYLRTKKAYVETLDRAEANVTVINTLNAFAFNKSIISYFKTPKNLTRHTQNSGNILQMAYWN